MRGRTYDAHASIVEAWRMKTIFTLLYFTKLNDRTHQTVMQEKKEKRKEKRLQIVEH